MNSNLILEQIEPFLNKHENPVVAGKDSIVVLHMVLQIRPSVAVVFNNTKCEFPDTLRLKRLAQFLLDHGKGVELFERLGAKWILENRPCYFDGVTL